MLPSAPDVQEVRSVAQRFGSERFRRTIRQNGALFRRFRIFEVAAWTALLLAVWPAYRLALRDPLIGAFHDDGIYAVTAKALATGQGYRIVSLPQGVPQTKYPPFFPFLLSLVWRFAPDFPANASKLLVVPLAAALCWMIAVFLLAKTERVPTAGAFVITALCTTSVFTMGYSTILISETTFGALLTLSLLLFRLSERQGRTAAAYVIAGGFLAGCAVLTRAVGVSLPIAVTAWLLYRRRIRDALLSSAVIGAVCLPWYVWTHLHRVASSGWLADYTGSAYGKWNVLLAAGRTAGERVRVIATNGAFLLVSPGLLLNFEIAHQLAIAVLLGSLVAFGFAYAIYKRPGLLPLFVTVYSFGILLWMSPDFRYAAPVFPFVLISGARAVPFKTRRAVWVLGVLSAVLLGHSFVKLYASAMKMAAGYCAWSSTTAAQDPGELPRMISWIKDNTPENAILAANQDPLLYLYTGRQAIRDFLSDQYDLSYEWRSSRRPLGTIEDLRNGLEANRADYLVTTADRDYAEAPYLHALETELIHKAPSAFHLVYSSSGDASRAEYAIYRVDRSALKEATGSAPESGSRFRTRFGDSAIRGRAP